MKGVDSCLVIIKEEIRGKKFVRTIPFDKLPDLTLYGHEHNYDHTTYVLKGSVVMLLAVKGEVVSKVSLKQGESFLVAAEIAHQITAQEPATIMECIFDHRTTDGKISSTQTGNLEAYHEKPYGLR